MKALIRTSLAVVFCLTLASVASAASPKFGVVDFQRVLRDSKAGKAAKAEMEQKGKSMEAELKTKGQDLENQKKRLEAESQVMTKEVKEEKARDFHNKVNDFNELQRTYAGDFKKFEAEKLKKIQDAVTGVLEKIAKKEGYTIIFERSRVLYHEDAVDLTDELIQLYDKQ
ncbi:MAG: OmpH family outer membrane protein [Desulfobacterales bacterium]|jgi:outer membrane protein